MNQILVNTTHRRTHGPEEKCVGAFGGSLSHRASKYAAILAMTDCVHVVSSSSSEVGIPYLSMTEAWPEVCTGGMGEEPPDTEDAW